MSVVGMSGEVPYSTSLSDRGLD